MAQRRTERQRQAAAMADARRRITPALLTLAEAAVYLGMPFETVKAKVYRTRELPSVQLPGHGVRRLRRLKRADLDRLIEQGTVPAFRLITRRAAS